MLLWAHEQLVQAEGGKSVPPQHHRPAGHAAKSSVTAQQSFKARPALAIADTNIGECAHQCAYPDGLAKPTCSECDTEPA